MIHSLHGRAALALAALLTAVLAACSGVASMRSAPDTLAGLPLHYQFVGPRALAAIQQLHGAGNIDLVDAWVAGYGDERASGMLYVGVASKRAGADALLQGMERRVAERPTPFHDLRHITVAGRDVGMLSGQGQRHFVYVVGRRVVWLSIDTGRACVALKQLLGHTPGEDTGTRCSLDGPSDNP